MSKTIYFDMDGTLYDLYGCAHWLEKLNNYDVSVYLCGAALCNLSSLARIINRMKKDGYKFYSQTDTEVIANLLQDKKGLSPLQALIEVTNSIKGTYALACLNKDEK